MRLSELPDSLAHELVRDAEFSAVGFVSHGAPDMLVWIGEARYLVDVEERPQVSAVICRRDLAPRVPSRLGLIATEDPTKSFYAIHDYLATRTTFYWRDFPTEVSPSASVAASAHIAPRNVRIGADTIVEPNASVLERSLVGARVVIGANCVVGSSAVQLWAVDGVWKRAVHAGGVWIEDDVQIQSNSTIVRSVFGRFTVIGQHTSLNSQVFVGHHTTIGAHGFVGAGATISGSVEIGDRVWIGPNATLRNGIRVADGAKVSLGAVVIGDVERDQRVTGHFAVEHRRFLRSQSRRA